ncbi:peroxidase family protein [Actinidia rufa]|uniref:peroxidase n=1 Tax=Actinidia rufa TaxID=165716 RepID=A0A7J0GEF4_9ERIC|nr:peroxidase family protein [Actinidia rufa]
MVEAVCPKKVSCADILILAAREAVAVSGGPQVIVPLGRRDSSSPPSYKLADSLLPPANLGVDGVLHIFANKGMSIEESVAIVGAHTLGVTHCHNLPSHHLSNTQVPMDPALDLMLSLGCPLGPRSQNTSFVFNDPTAFIFDNVYYANAMSGHGILRIDSELPLDPRTGPFVKHFASDQDGFFRAFSSAFVKLSSFGVLTGNEGVIRASCDKI